MLRPCRAAGALASASNGSSVRLGCLLSRLSKSTKHPSNLHVLSTAVATSQRREYHVSETDSGILRARSMFKKTSVHEKFGAMNVVTAVVFLRRVHCYRCLSLQQAGPANGRAAASTTSSAERARRDDEQRTPAAVAEASVDNTADCNYCEQASLQELLGITDTEAEALRSNAQTTKPGYNNLVATAATAADDGGDCGRTGLRPLPSSFVRFLLDDLDVKPKEVKALVLRKPGVLRRSKAAVDEVSRWLRDGVGMDDTDVGRLLLRYPEAGQLSVENNLEPKVAWLRENLKTDNRGVARILRHAPQLLGRSIEKSLEPKLRWLEDRLRISREKAARMARSLPMLFVYSASSKIEPTVAWLQQRLDLDESLVLAMVAATPSILGMNVETGLEPKLAWLRDRLGLNNEEICRIIRSHPAILVRSIENSLEPKLAWLTEELKLDKDATKVMLMRYPTITGASLEGNLKLKLPWLQKTLGLDQEEAVALVRRSPSVLPLSLTGNLEPTVSFYREEMRASEEELRWSLLQNPSLLTLSLDGRLRPRVAAMREAKMEPLFSKHLEHVVLWPDAKFRSFVVHARGGGGSAGKDAVA